MTRAPQPVSITAEELAERDAMLAERDALRGELRVTKVERDLLKEQLKAHERRKHLATTVIDDGENRHQSGAHHFRFDGHHCDSAGSQAG